MRRHGWAGDIPADDEEAIARIVAAARRVIDEDGTVNVSRVAEDLGITRPTLYRYFPNLEALLRATAMSAVSAFLDNLAVHLQTYTAPTDAVVEGIAFTLEQLPHDRYLGMVMQPGKASAFTAGVTGEIAITFGRSILNRFNVDWRGSGFDDTTLTELVEFMLRTLQSLIIDPGRPPRHGTDLRTYLHDWIAPAVQAHCRAAVH
ncbi:DNA-binding transcriptional regulator, AcrR family [Mycolicibacterium rutilum]|uniref:DNA-binding transcriptional regulator, AcrR family n=1 Tax=Mycolicibacterium rutilum TaxID=370526 RepID=A0A1H6IYA9_MYCRU|nr:TetR/AcrR family transcriptional regulator [Mycolicibacterium rutilum]SEH54190.1 DNA-binding transcriptional regulator, AcrR family [Mycolicibacterium rutilum]